MILLMGFVFGIFRYTQSELPPHVPTVAEHAGQTVRISGTVMSEVERTISGQSLVLSDVNIVETSVDGKVLVRMPLYPSIRYGDTIHVSCRLQRPEPFNGFAYDRYLKSKGILATCSFPKYVDVQHASSVSFLGTLLSIKSFLIDRLDRVIPEPHTSFLAGLLFGGASALSGDLRDDFSQTGTSHILAASGFNISLFSIAFLAWILATRLPRKRALALTAVLLVFYVLIAGATPALVRATLMAGLILVQHVVRREPHRLNMLLLAASVMFMLNPRILLDDPGFQLSFMATAAILYLVPLWSDRFDFLPNRFGMRDACVASLAASLCTAPIILWHFGNISFISPLVNLLVLPFVPFAMLLTAIAILGSFLGPLASMLAIPAWACSKLILSIIILFGSFT